MYKPINGWTKRKILNFILDKFHGKSYTEYGTTCLYQDNAGRRCAVGLFIPNTHMSRVKSDDLNFSTLDDLLSHYPLLETKMPLEYEAMKKLQSVHDGGTYDSRHDLMILVNMIEWVEANVA